ncbi:PEP/pyruvate-binding domain-containing protein [Paenibacillus sp. Leaf72]|uniref:PEP/pyruvate-binding domain-containing protein n=1 Tax=Paenibacillus sp. Leaf72 TaxID=1736234 RepID=UPI0006FA66CC|nr:PEP/pyruvate-binding domain-containing protein [Paenibacillus sp. Leaf72]KQO18027.1 phosphoenolpyruvate synthase [Paenibacillus sp. Leaf72]
MILFGTKSETLERLERLVKCAIVLPQLQFTAYEWRYRQSEILDSLKQLSWSGAPLIVRSSAAWEDGIAASYAGRYDSVLDVNGESEAIQAVNRVLASYQDEDPVHHVFIQPMLPYVAISGVAFGVNPNNGGNYIVINYDDVSGATDAVTSGTTNHLKTYHYFKGSPLPAVRPLNQIVDLMDELEHIFETPRLDIEFAVDKAGKLYLFQVRPLLLTCDLASLDHQSAILKRIYDKVGQGQARQPYLYGHKTVYGVMPDWNPAEIIGIRPRPLALSLYKELVTDSIWAYQRSRYGYKNVRSFPLLIDLGGFPYIDVRVSFNSFLPKELDAELSEKLLNYYMQSLIDNPQNHDKVEFEIIFSCFTFDLDTRLEILYEHGFTKPELKQLSLCLKDLTNHIVCTENGLLQNDLSKINELEARCSELLDSSIDKVSKIYWLLEDCKRYGTLPFAGLARGGFVAVQMLRSLVSIGILSESDYHHYMSSLETVSTQISMDYAQLDMEEFLAKYGHLRPGTYEICSLRYDEAPDQYFEFSSSRELNRVIEKPSFFLSLAQYKRIQALLTEHGLLDGNVLGLFDFFKTAIEGREYSKFVFTKSLSEAIRLFGQLAEEYGISKEEASFANIEVIKRAYESDCDIQGLLLDSVKAGRQRYEATLQLELPPLITEPSNVWFFSQPELEPNFITMNQVTSKIAFSHEDHESLRGSILFLPSADPGYDWIFSKGIAGLVTMYGGVNSHMAIRAGELSIPAVIGVGENLYNHYGNAKVLAIDCAGKNMRIIQ